jgi:hypothetical protein
MKIIAGRPQDIGDAEALIQRLGLTEPQQVIDILRQYIPSQYLTARVQYVVEELFA